MTHGAAQNVSRETLEMLRTFSRTLEKWNCRVNLIAKSTLPVLWTRHIEDSLQLHELAPPGDRLVDLGSGGGLPGMVMAIARPDTRVTLVESDQRKCAFLQSVAHELRLGVDIQCRRVEHLAPLAAPILTARALAPLTTLLDHASRHLAPEGRAFFPKGARHQEELSTALRHWRFSFRAHPSRTDQDAVIYEIWGVSHA